MAFELKEELREFRFAMSGGQKKNIRKGRELKRDIARVKTILNERGTTEADTENVKENS